MRRSPHRQMATVLFFCVFLACSFRSPFAAAGDGVKVLRGHVAGVFSVALSRDGQVLASASNDNTVRVWDVATGAALTTLSKEFSVVSAVAISSNGSNLAMGSQDGSVFIWDSSSGEEPTTLAAHRGIVRCLAYSADDRWLASGGADRSIRVWSAKTGEVKKILDGHARGVFCLAFSPDGKTLASGSSDESVKTWDVERGTEETRETLRQRPKHGPIVSLAFSPDGQELAVTTASVVEVWEAAQSVHRSDLPCREKGAIWWSARYSREGRLIAIGSGSRYARTLRVDAKKGVSTGTHQAQDEEIRLWDVQTKREIGHLVGHREAVRTVALSADATLLVSGSRDRTVRIWDLSRLPNGSRPAAGSVNQVAAQSDAVESSSSGAAPSEWNQAQRGAPLWSFDYLTAPFDQNAAQQQDPAIDGEQFDPTIESWAFESGDGACYFWGDLIGLIQINPTPGHAGSNAGPHKPGAVSPPIVSQPVGHSPEVTAWIEGNSRATAGWSRRLSYQGPTRFPGSPSAGGSSGRGGPLHLDAIRQGLSGLGGSHGGGGHGAASHIESHEEHDRNHDHDK
jgi:WD40 repeat protein